MIKHLLLTIIPVAICAANAFCQGVHLGNVKQLPLPEGSYRPVISPDGGTLLFSAQDGKALKSFDMDNAVIQTIDESAAAGAHPVFSSDSKSVIYRTAEIKDRLMYRDVREADLYSGKVTVTEKMSRKQLSLKALPKHRYAFADYDRICLSNNGELTEIKPLSDAHSYLSASLCPDGSRILFIEPFQGLFVCNTDGSDVRNIAGRADDAAWADNNSLVFVVSHSDGYAVLTSALMYYNLTDNSWSALTGEDIMPAEVTASEADSTIVFSTQTGEIFSAELIK